MREVFKLIPIDYTLKVLDLMGMPSKRYIFADSWYVPVEEYMNRQWLEQYLANQGYTKIMRAPDNGDRHVMSLPDAPEGKIIWGDGELRYFLIK